MNQRIIEFRHQFILAPVKELNYQNAKQVRSKPAKCKKYEGRDGDSKA